jgi:hypothetical protein
MTKKDRIFLGMLTPSSNTTLEPVTASMLMDRKFLRVRAAKCARLRRVSGR